MSGAVRNGAGGGAAYVHVLYSQHNAAVCKRHTAERGADISRPANGTDSQLCGKQPYAGNATAAFKRSGHVRRADDNFRRAVPLGGSVGRQAVRAGGRGIFPQRALCAVQKDTKLFLFQRGQIFHGKPCHPFHYRRKQRAAKLHDDNPHRHTRSGNAYFLLHNGVHTASRHGVGISGGGASAGAGHGHTCRKGAPAVFVHAQKVRQNERRRTGKPCGHPRGEVLRARGLRGGKVPPLYRRGAQVAA